MRASDLFISQALNIYNNLTLTFRRYTVPAIFRAPPADPSISYAPFVSPTTADLISTYTIPAIRATLEELLTLGKSFYFICSASLIMIRITHRCVGRALGFPDSPDGLPSSVVDSAIEGTRKIHERPDSTHVPSMLLDAQKGLPIEVEVILGEVVRMAKAHNVPLPVGLRGCFCCSVSLTFSPSVLRRCTRFC